MPYSSILLAMDLSSLADCTADLSHKFFLNITELSYALHHPLATQDQIPPVPLKSFGTLGKINQITIIIIINR